MDGQRTLLTTIPSILPSEQLRQISNTKVQMLFLQHRILHRVRLESTTQTLQAQRRTRYQA
jgi:hypothetical protein